MDIAQKFSPDEIEEMREKPSVFVEKLFGIEPYPYQKEFLDSDNRRRLWVAGRQVGKSTALAWLALHRFVMHPGSHTLIISPTQRQAKELFDVRLKEVISHWLDDSAVMEQVGIVYETKEEIEGTNGSRIKALPSAARIRGFTADTIIVDEAHFIDNEVFVEKLKPMMFTTQGEFILASTPMGRTGYFYSKYGSENWATLQTSTYECPAILDEDIEEMEDEMTKRQFKQEVMGIFGKSENQLIDPELIKACRYTPEDSESRFPDYQGGNIYLGVDIGRKIDPSTFVSVDDYGNVFHAERKDDYTIPETVNMVRRLHRENGYKKILIDETGIGGGPLDYLKQDMRNVEGMMFSTNSKQSVYNTLIREMEDDSLVIPDLKLLLRELEELEAEETKQGKTSIDHPSDGSDDYADALALAVYAKEGGRNVDPADRAYPLSSETSAPETTGDEEHDSQNQSRAYTFTA